MAPSSELLKQLARQSAMIPQEQVMEVGRRKQSLSIGIPKEITFHEHRVPLTPQAVAVLAGRGHEVVIERGAGAPAQFQDNDYSEAGAMVVDGPAEVFKAEIILKVAPPTHAEIEMLRHKQTLISALQLTVQPKDTLKRMMEKRMTAVAWDFIKDREGIYPIVRAMGEIAGNTSVQVASEHLSADKGGPGLMLGGISGVAPAEVVVIGAGTVGEFATRAALGLGASVQVFDDNIYRLMRLQNNLGQRIYTSVLDPLALQQKLARAHVAVGALRAVNGKTPVVVTEEMVMAMKKGAVIIDVSIDHGGCFATSRVTNHNEPIFFQHDVIHYCVPNMSSNVSRTASYAISNILSPMLKEAARHGGIEKYLRFHPGFCHGAYLYKGALTKEHLSQRFDLKFTDLELILSAAF